MVEIVSSNRSTYQNSDSCPQRMLQKRLYRFHQLWQRIVSFFTALEGLSISQRGDRQGNLKWRVYDRYTGKTFWFTSEDELRIWLDQGFRL